MDGQYSHAFINKPFYKQFHKCTKCNKRNLWNPIVKCSGCRTYCHQTCIQPDDDVCCRPDSNTEDLGLADSDVAVVEEHPEDVANVSCADMFKLAERRPYAMDGNLGTDTQLRDLIPEPVYDELVSEVDQNAKGLRPTSDEITSKECNSNITTLANEKAPIADAFHQSAEHISDEELEDDQRFRHKFVNKPIYKWVHKCSECEKRTLLNPIAKCSGCSTYYHRKCIQPDVHIYCIRDDESGLLSIIDGDDLVAEENPEQIAHVSCAEISKLADQRSYAMDGNLNTGTGLQDQIFEPMCDESVSEVDKNAKSETPTFDGITSIECGTSITTLANGEAPIADALVSLPAFYQSAEHISDEELEDDQRFRHKFVNKPIYKWVHKCSECEKRTLLNPIAKCSGCSTYYHRKCIQPDVHIYCIRDDESGLLSIIDGDDLVAEENPEQIAHVSCAEISKLADQRSYAVDGNLDTGTGLQDQIFEPMCDESVSDVDKNAKSEKPTFDGITSIECSTSISTLANGEALITDEHRSLPSIHQMAEHISVDKRFRHNFVNKPIYKWLRKCADCGKRKIWNPIAKCSGCKTYCHRMCIQPDDDVYCRPDPPELTLQIIDLNQDTVVGGLESDDQDTITRPTEDVHDPEVVTSADENDLKSADSHVAVAEDHSDGIADITCAENLMFAEQRPNAMDGNLDTGTQDLISEAIVDDKSMLEVCQNTEDTRRASDAITSDKCRTTTLANDDAQAADGHRSSSSTQRFAGHISECCWMNMEFPRSCWPTRSRLTNTMPIEASSDSDPTSYRLPSPGTEADERQEEDDSVEKNNPDTCCDDDNPKETNEEETNTMTLISQCIIS